MCYPPYKTCNKRLESSHSLLNICAFSLAGCTRSSPNWIASRSSPHVICGCNFYFPIPGAKLHTLRSSLRRILARNIGFIGRWDGRLTTVTTSLWITQPGKKSRKNRGRSRYSDRENAISPVLWFCESFFFFSFGFWSFSESGLICLQISTVEMNEMEYLCAMGRTYLTYVLFITVSFYFILFWITAINVLDYQ